jgi:signal transduction histidine kinase
VKQITYSDIFQKILAQIKRSSFSCVFIDTNTEQDAWTEAQATFPSQIPLYHKVIPFRFAPSPYYPFLSLLQEWLIGTGDPWMTIKDMVDIKPMHKDLLQHYFRGETGLRPEEIEYDQIFYDKQELHSTLIDLFVELGKGRQGLVVVQSLEHLSSDGIEFLEALLERAMDLDLAWVFTLNLRMSLQYGKEDATNQLKQLLYKEDFSLFRLHDEHFQTPESQGAGTSLRLDDQINNAITKYNFLDLGSAEADLRQLREDLRQERDEVSGQRKRKVEFYLGEIFFLRNRLEDSLVVFNGLLEAAMNTDDKDLLASVYRKLGECYLYKQNYEMAKKLVHQGKKIAQANGDLEELIKSEALYLSTILGYAHRTEYDTVLDSFHTVIDEGTTLGQLYIVARAYGNLVADNNVIAYEITTEEQRMEWCDKGVAIARDLRNDHLLGALLHNKAVIYSNLGDKKQAFKHYKLSEKYKVKVGNIREIVRIYNGFGYAYFIEGDFKKALDYYTKSVGLLTETQDYLEICLTIFNIAECYFFALHYEETIYYLNMMIQLMGALGLDRIPFHGIYEAYAMLGVAYEMTGKSIKALDILETVKAYYTVLSDKDEVFTDFLTTFLSSKEDIEENIRILRERLAAFSSSSEGKIIKQWVFVAIAICYRRLGMKAKAIEEIKAFERIYPNPLDLYHRQAQYQLELCQGEKPRVHPKVTLKKVKIDFYTLFQIVNTKMALNKLHHKINDINFLNNLQQRLLDQSRDLQNLIQEILNIIYDIFVAEMVMFFQSQKGQWNTFSHNEVVYEMEAAIKGYFLNNPREVLIIEKEDRSNLPLTLQSLNSIMSLPVYGVTGLQGILFLATKKPELSFKKDDFEVLAISAKQIGAAIDNRVLLEKMAQYNKEMEDKNKEKEDIIDQLVVAQNQLVESEKMASLGSLVAGVAHEINTPLGISITTATYIAETAERTLEDLERGDLKKSFLEQAMKDVTEGMSILTKNLKRSAELVRSFKQVAVDQSVDDLRKFNLKNHILEILTSLSPKLKECKVDVVVDCPEEIEIFSYPGTFYKILNNLVLNSVIHGLEGRADGKISIEAKALEDGLHLSLADNGKGMNRETQKRIFDPFYTTRRNRGGVGLGMSIVFNLVTQRLRGKIRLETTEGKGSLFMIHLPKNILYDEEQVSIE